MARLLIKADNSTDPDQSAVYARGDVVVVMEDGHEWGGMEGLPDFLRLDIPGTPASKFEYLTASQESQANEAMSPATRKIQNMFLVLNRQRDRLKTIKNRRRFSIDVDSISFVNGKAVVADINPRDKRKIG